MTGILKVALWLAIALTLIGLAAPALATPSFLIEALGFGKALPVRLFGVALVALAIGLWSAIRQLRAGIVPKSLLLMGVVAYAGIAVVIGYSGVTGQFILLADWVIDVLTAVAVVSGFLALVLGLGLFADRGGAGGR